MGGFDGRLVLSALLCGLWYVMAAGGLLLLFWDSWAVVCRQAILRGRYHAARKNHVDKSRLQSHLHMVLQASMKHPCSAQMFCLWTAAIFFSVLVASLRTFGGLTAVSIGGMAASMPYCLLRLRLELQRKKGSMEGEKVTSELLRQYRISGDNICEALERAIPQLRDCRVCQKQLFRLLLVLRNTGSAAEMKQASDIFAYSIGTNWSYMLSSSIRLSAEKGVSIALGLEDILVQMRQAQASMEERKRMNSESARITVFLVPLLYGATIWLSLYYLELPFSRFLANQIGTPEGLFLLLASIFLFALNLAVLEVVGNQKLDF